MNLNNERIISEQNLQSNLWFETQKHITFNNLEFNKEEIIAHLSDSRTVIIPLAWFKRLRKANLVQLQNYQISPAGCGIHWEELDEDISIKAFVNGLKGGCCH